MLLKIETGLPMSTYFSAFKIKWLMDNVLQVKDAVRENRCAFGTVDSWLLWVSFVLFFTRIIVFHKQVDVQLKKKKNLIGTNSVHVTDVTNASRTMLMNLKTLDWDDQLCSFFGISKSILPQIKSSAENYGLINVGSLKGVPITAVSR